mgnify:CR=1 FL=1
MFTIETALKQVGVTEKQVRKIRAELPKLNREKVDHQLKILLLIHLQQPMTLAHRDWLTDHGSWELNLVEMQFMFGVILLYLP